MLGTTSTFAEEMVGVFGIEFGKALSETITLDHVDRSKLSKILDSQEVAEFSYILDNDFGALVAPPKPNHHYSIYLILYTPLTKRIGAVWARGPQSSDCVVTNNLLADYLLKKYEDIEFSLLTDSESRRKGLIWLRSERLQISFSCGALEIKDKVVEKQFELELEQVIRKRLLEEKQTDTSGL